MSASPTQRTLEHCRKLGWDAGVVERWNPHARIRHDLFGFVDIVAIDQCSRVHMIQATSTANMQARINKIEDDENMARIARALGAHGVVEVWGWAKRGAKGKRKTWTLRRAVREYGEWLNVDNENERIWPASKTTPPTSGAGQQP